MSRLLAIALSMLLCVPFCDGQQKSEYVYTSGTNAGTSAFSVNGTTGLLTSVAGSPFAVTGAALVADPFGHFLFSGGTGIDVAAINSATGALTPVPGSPFMSNLMFAALAVSPDGRFLYAGSGTSLYSFEIDVNRGALASLGSPSTVAFPVISLAVHPSGAFLYAGTNYLYEFAVNQQNGTLTNLGSIDSGQAVAISSNGKYLYAMTVDVIPADAAFVNAYSINLTSGALTPVAGSPFNVANTYLANLALDRTGQFLYEITDTESVAGFLLNTTTGALEEPVPGSPFLDDVGFPNQLVIDRSNQFVYSANTGPTYGLVDGLTINQRTGGLSLITAQSSKVPAGTYAITSVVPQASSTATLTSLSIRPTNPTVDITSASTEQFTAVGTYSDGTSQFLFASVNWNSSNPAVATISNSPGQNGLATLTGMGQTIISAELNGITAQATLTAERSALVSIAVSPANPSIQVGTSLPFTATGTFADGTTLDLTNSVTWKSANVKIAFVNPKGIALGRSAGRTAIVAQSGSVYGSTVVTVTPRTGNLEEY